MLAEATMAYLEKTGKGDRDRALAAVRKAKKLDPTLHESHFWGQFRPRPAEQTSAGRLYSLHGFCPHSMRYKTLRKKAGKQLHGLAGGTAAKPLTANIAARGSGRS
jgi:hypothetical protein